MTQIYKVGTATVTNGSTTVEGTDTGWATALVTGGLFTRNGLSVPIESVTDEDTLVLALAWPGPTSTGAYSILRENSAAASVVDLSDRLRQATITLSLHSIHPDFVGTLAQINALDLTPEDTEFVAARLEDGQPDEYYRWGGTEWVGPFPIRGTGDPGEDGDNAYVYVAYASDASGTGFTTTFNPALDYIAILSTDTEIVAPVAGDFAGLWKNYKGATGENFDPNEVVPLIADRDAFDDEPKMFAVLVESDVGNDDLPTLYFKLSATTADWSGGFTFIGGGGGDVAGEVHAADTKRTPHDADEFALVDSEASNVLKKFTWASFKAAIWTALGGLIIDGTGKTTIVDGDHFAIGDSADSNASKKFSWANLKATLRSGGTIRELLTSNRTYYVRSDGNDSNNGLSDTSGGAFLTIAKAVSAALAIDPSIYDVTIVLQNGTWGQVSMSTPMIGNKAITIQGSGSANVTLSGTVCANVGALGAALTLTGLTLNGTINCINVTNGGTINIGSDIVFAGNASSAHIRVNGPGSTVQINANYSITSGAARHLMASPNGFINAFARTITMSGTLNFSSAFADCDRGGLISTNGSTFTGGTVTGKRYNVATNGVIFTGGAGASHFPGDSTGTAVTGGQYA